MHKKLLLYDLGDKSVQPNRLSSGSVCKNVREERKNEHKKWKVWRNVQWVEQVIDDELSKFQVWLFIFGQTDSVVHFAH